MGYAYSRFPILSNLYSASEPRHEGSTWTDSTSPAATEMETMKWARGEVAGVSLDGKSLQIKMVRGVMPQGARVGIYLTAPENPSPHYMWDEMRELRVAEATVLRVVGDSCDAEIVKRSSEARISVGDKVIELTP